MAKIKINKGDLFYFQMDQKYAIGIIVDVGKYEMMIGIFDALYNELPDLNQALLDLKDKKIVVVAKTDDLFFKLKRWFVIGNMSINFELPKYFKIETTDGTFVCDSDLNLIRKATPIEIKQLSYVSSVSASTIVTATKMYHGMEPMIDAYKKYFVNT